MSDLRADRTPCSLIRTITRAQAEALGHDSTIVGGRGGRKRSWHYLERQRCAAMQG
jgi:hypothetical protein